MTRKTSIFSGLAVATLAAASAFGQQPMDYPPAVPAASTAPMAAAPAQPTAQSGPGAQGVQGARGYGMQGQAGPKVLVIPFATLNVPEGEEWIGRAVQEDIVADFGRARAFSPVEFKGNLMVEDNSSAIALAHRANADYVIRGAAQMVEGKLRITAQFIDSRNGDTVATASVTGSPKELLKLEDDVSAQLRTSAVPVVAAEQQQQPMQYAPGYPVVPQSDNAGYTPGYTPSYGYMPNYLTQDYGTSYPQTYAPDYTAYDSGYGYPYYGGDYGGYYGAPLVFFGGGFFDGRGFRRGGDHDRDGRGFNGGFNRGGFNRGSGDHGDHGNVGFSTTFNGGGRTFSGGIRPVTGNVSHIGFQGGGFQGGGISHGFTSGFSGGFSHGMGGGGFSGGGFGGRGMGGGFGGGGGHR